MRIVNWQKCKYLIPTIFGKLPFLLLQLNVHFLDFGKQIRNRVFAAVNIIWLSSVLYALI